MSLKYKPSAEPHPGWKYGRNVGESNVLVSELQLGGVPREQNMLKGLLPRVIYHQVY